MADQYDFGQNPIVDENGYPIPGALAYFYAPGTLALRDIYADQAETILLPNPLPANAAAIHVPVWSALPLKVNVTTPTGAAVPGYPLELARRAFSELSVAAEISFAPVAGVAATNVQQAIEVVATDADEALTALEDSLGTFATENVTTRTALQAVWTAGTDIIARMIEPLILKTTIDNRVNATVDLRKSSTSGELTITSGGFVSFTHGLGAIPKIVQLSLICKVADAGYAVNDVILADASNTTSSGANRSNNAKMTSTTIRVRFSDQTGCFVTANDSSGAFEVLTNSAWRLIITVLA